ncbi:MAG: helix-turn-helix transcriptional regulator [Sulfurifustis sp.]
MLPKEAVVTDADTTTRPYGTLAHQVKDNGYMMRCGFIYTSPWVVTAHTVRHPAAILLTAKHAPFDLSVNGVKRSYQAVAIKPVTARGLTARNVMLVSIHLHPNHPHFRLFRAIPDPGVLDLDRSRYAAFDSALEAAYRGSLDISEATRLFDDIVATTVQCLPKAKRTDSRVERAIALLQQDPAYPLTQLAATLGVSYDRMSHLFSETVGLPLRSYQLWQKAYNASFLLHSGRPLTDIAHAAGFSDSAHLSRIFQNSYGISPSYFMDRNAVRYVCDHDVAAKLFRKGA